MSYVCLKAEDGKQQSAGRTKYDEEFRTGSRGISVSVVSDYGLGHRAI